MERRVRQSTIRVVSSVSPGSRGCSQYGVRNHGRSFPCVQDLSERVEGTAVAIADIRRDRHGSTDPGGTQLACETGFYPRRARNNPRRRRQGPNGMQVLRQDNDGVNGERTFDQHRT